MAKINSENNKIQIYNARTGRVEEVEKIQKSAEEWKKILSPEEFKVARLKDTEKPYTGQCDIPRGKGIYQCLCCGTDLFAVGTKFVSGTGWPSFWNPISDLNIRTEKDSSFGIVPPPAFGSNSRLHRQAGGGMDRIEVLCARCDAHLGHVFNDGPPPTELQRGSADSSDVMGKKPTGLRYCINSVALKFIKAEPKILEKATFAAGCFWGVEEAFRTEKGVILTVVGYTGGKTKNPTYEEVCTGKTGHAEAVEIEFDPSVLSYEKLLEIFWDVHDPTTLNRQGPDIGTQYRSAIFFHNEEQKKSALASKKRPENSGKNIRKIVTEIVPAAEFFKAEEYHQKYDFKRGVPSCRIKK